MPSESRQTPARMNAQCCRMNAMKPIGSVLVMGFASLTPYSWILEALPKYRRLLLWF